MEKLKALSRHPRFALHAFYAFTSLLIVIFLIFSAVSGPGTKYYWLEIRLKTDSKTGIAGEQWSLGGLGSCSGDVCSLDAPHANVVRGCLLWHLAVGVIFFLSAIIQAVLVLRPPNWDAIVLSWLCLLLPPMAFLPLGITFVTDFAVRSSIGNSENVESVKIQGSFWLSAAATITGLIWVIVAECIMSRERKKRRQDEEDAREAKEARETKRRAAKGETEGLGVLARLNPWHKPK